MTWCEAGWLCIVVWKGYEVKKEKRPARRLRVIYRYFVLSRNWCLFVGIQKDKISLIVYAFLTMSKFVKIQYM